MLAGCWPDAAGDGSAPARAHMLERISLHGRWLQEPPLLCLDVCRECVWTSASGPLVLPLPWNPNCATS